MVWGAQFQFSKTHGLIRLIQCVMAESERVRKEYWKTTITFHFQIEWLSQKRIINLK